MGRKQRSASVDRWSELSEDETLLVSRASTSGASSGHLSTIPKTTVTSPVGPPPPFPGYASTSPSSSSLPTPNGLYPSYATIPRVTRATMPKQQHKSTLQTQQSQHQQQSTQPPPTNRVRSSCDTLKEISNMKLPGSGGVYGRAGALKLILSSTTSESDDSKTNNNNGKKSATTPTKKNSASGKSLSCAAKNNSNSNVYAASTSSSSPKEEDGGKVGGGGGARLVRRASASFRNWLSGSDRSDDDDARESGWYSDYDLTSYRRHAVHLNNNAGARAASNAALVAGLAAAAAASSSTSGSGGYVGGRGSTLSRTFKSLLSPNPKISTAGRRSKSPRVPAACSAAAAATAATPGGGAVSSSSEDLAF